MSKLFTNLLVFVDFNFKDRWLYKKNFSEKNNSKNQYSLLISLENRYYVQTSK
jgi:hypothetical protein